MKRYKETCRSGSGLDPEMIRVELFAVGLDMHSPSRIPLQRKGPASKFVNVYTYSGEAPASRPANYYTPRILPFHPHAAVPLECQEIFWMR